MALERQPKYLSLNPQAVKSYRPPDSEVYKWHTVVSGQQENFRTIAAKYMLPVEKIIEFNFPGSVEGGRVIPEIVNWYLHYHEKFGCPETQDRLNRIFKGGEKIAIPRVAGSGPKPPSFSETQKWFVEKVIPLRTAARGYSSNRVYKTPRSWIWGNVEDANGLCGDVSIFVAEEFFRHFRSDRTADGFVLGMVLWDGLILNHIANVMLPQGKIRKESYVYDSPTRQAKPKGTGAGQYDSDSLLSLCVLDLYYKMPPHALGVWWTERDTSREGTITIGLQQDFAE